MQLNDQPPMALDEYRKKRSFDETPEPAGRGQPSDSGLSFVVQMHDASRLHYDFRLAIEGVLVSWAVPKGPSMNPADKRLAVQTEDHPLEYADFEGAIPAGHYGAGTVMVWDRGAYESADSEPLARQLHSGEIKVVLHGEKLRGRFTLIHTGKRSSDRQAKKQWLLIKGRDEEADRSWDIEDSLLDRSVLSGRTLSQIAAGATA